MIGRRPMFRGGLKVGCQWVWITGGAAEHDPAKATSQGDKGRQQAKKTRCKGVVASLQGVDHSKGRQRFCWPAKDKPGDARRTAGNQGRQGKHISLPKEGTGGRQRGRTKGKDSLILVRHDSRPKGKEREKGKV